jgi:nicotinate phosphoribosyltransferase
MAYKLEEYAGQARRKRSAGKATWPGRKQVFRERDASCKAVRDRIALVDETPPGEPLLIEIMRDGRRVVQLPTLAAVREYCRAEIARLPEDVLRLEAGPAAYPVQVSAKIEALTADLDSASARC